jgi:hypothetical protein
MQLKLTREQYRPDSTVGHLFVDGAFECFTLEDGIRTHKVHGRTAIPAGTYRVTVEDSPRFKRKLPRLHEVPNFTGVLIHAGNTAAHTEGCILVGQQWTPGQEAIGASRLAFEAIFPKITDAIARGESVSIAVLQENAPAELATRAIRAPAAAKPKSKRKTEAKSKRARKKPPARKPARPKPAAASRRRAKTGRRAKTTRSR